MAAEGPNGFGRRPKVIVAGPTALLRDVLRVEATHAGFDVVGEAAHPSELAERALEPEADVVVLELGSQGSGWADVIIDLRDSATHVLALTDDTSPERVIELLHVGVDGVLRTDVSPGDVMAAIRSLADGGAALASDVAALVLHQWRTMRTTGGARGGSVPGQLTPREFDVLAALVEGLSTKAVARRLGMAHKTVENHKTRIFQKLGARGNAHAVSIAIRQGLLQQPTNGSTPGSAPSPG